MHIAILGRQPHIGMAELERRFGHSATSWLNPQVALIDTPDLTVDSLGGSLKAGKVAFSTNGDWNSAHQKVIQHYQSAFSERSGKLTLGISAYGFDSTSPRQVQKIGLILKSKLKPAGVNVRLIPNSEASLSSATSHHNKLGLANNKVELLIINGANGQIVVAESTGSQNITAIARRDQGRPKRDAFVGMLPPKLATIMVNLATAPAGPETSKPATVLDPFCGTGVLLQEAMLLGFNAYGTDLSERMIEYSEANLDWLASKYRLSNLTHRLHPGDAIETRWQQPIDAVASETYLGQPFSAPPATDKLNQVRRNCNLIISKFLINLSKQLKPGTPVCLGVPAWRDTTGRFSHLPLVSQLDELGYRQIEFTNVDTKNLIYYREDQVVARQLLVLEAK